jgi:molybdate transport system substrate-binding protein
MRLLLAIIAFLALSSHSFGKELLVSCAAGMMELLKHASSEYQKLKGKKLLLNVSSSGRLAAQIERGAPVDAFISASWFWVEWLKDKGLVEKSSITPVASTKLVVVVPKGSRLKSLNEAERIAVGNKFAPVGAYAVESLKKLNLYQELKDRIVYAPTVRAITLWVLSGNADAGIIYYSDFIKYKDRLKLLKVLPEGSHEPIRFYGACTKRKPGECEEFLDFLKGLPEDFYQKFGFEKVR